MKKVYINSACSISPQNTSDNSGFPDAIIDHENMVLPAQSPNYRDYIAPAAARRMAKGIKMGIMASKIALREAGIEQVDAIITGTGLGCVRDSEKFVQAIIDNEEQYLTPTSFIQSTHNTVGGQIALEIQCKGYNFTYVHSSVSFESALIDAQLQLENEEARNILVGGVDELGDHTVAIHQAIGHVKKKKVRVSQLLGSGTPGAVFGEGAVFFVLSSEKHNRTYAQLISVKTFNTLPREKVTEAALRFLEENNTDISDTDLLILGNNGDTDYDLYFDELASGPFRNTAQAFYKHLSGEYHTASAFGTWLAAQILKTQILPEAVQLNNKTANKYDTVLLYNQYRGENHSFILLKRC
ncbi:beta-ketoacyl synthase chain length factor [Sinomicrobium kalidii]|uniref:beta-ketoacyl synthase N-terminal-like domain-containing protein n=1 Tax=Sinomicrobium kalidii TaxID=2900738 RepID=UPI001E4C561C|nr:beta-ketoacyl synthase N-terminal-like domain-containing protein [Sinomicrobium kalidii]UGU15786.1 beta-ketoacyl synthase chain length factor [Sinomicrobium kalidii]